MYFSVYFSTEVLSVDGYRWIQTPSVIQDFGVCGDTLPPKRNQTGPWFFETKVSARVNFDVLPTFEEMPKVPMTEAFPPAGFGVSTICIGTPVDVETCIFIMNAADTRVGMDTVANLQAGSISNLRGLIQMRTKENKGQKKSNLKFLDLFYFLLQIQLFSYIETDYVELIRHYVVCQTLLQSSRKETFISVLVACLRNAISF